MPPPVLVSQSAALDEIGKTGHGPLNAINLTPDGSPVTATPLSSGDHLRRQKLSGQQQKHTDNIEHLYALL